MISKVIIFEDEVSDQKEFAECLEATGREILIIEHAEPQMRSTSENIIKFAPQLAIVDSRFKSDVDGVDIVKYLNKTFPQMPIIICSRLYDSPKTNKWLEGTYRKLPGVCNIMSVSHMSN